ncbi:DNA-directed RNA polymerase subunit omega [Desulfotomaculum arcticum]|uniref:DNA-directed RNA polymerase subunit omega n=1 Tax=Desulfotruncus arcticus DSM 17038 TaxID=1121424 RepID=A0A1I2R7A9_9FIRM|nr:DNA-directed RNA polymerase subunit omega [Desulfotomaculum arcticum] [Desulfotruncus arcticus DSM 17038]
MAMHKPSLDKLMQRVDSRYSLVVITAKRARQLTEIALQQDVDKDGEAAGNPVSSALFEVVKGNIKFRRTRQGIK